MKMNSTMNIVDNYRPVLDLGSRKLKASFDEGLKQADPTAAGVVLKISNVVLLMVLFLGAVF